MLETFCRRIFDSFVTRSRTRLEPAGASASDGSSSAASVSAAIAAEAAATMASLCWSTPSGERMRRRPPSSCQNIPFTTWSQQAQATGGVYGRSP